jgi:hypothetical protein
MLCFNTEMIVASLRFLLSELFWESKQWTMINRQSLCHNHTPACMFVVLSQGGCPPGSSKKAAAALAGTSKPRFKAMPVSFNFAVEKVLYLEAELLSALKEIK